MCVCALFDFAERDGELIFSDSSINVQETDPDGQVEVCVVVSTITGTVETAFDVTLDVADNTAGRCMLNRVACWFSSDNPIHEMQLSMKITLLVI